jgi:hypothetical protein
VGNTLFDLVGFTGFWPIISILFHVLRDHRGAPKPAFLTAVVAGPWWHDPAASLIIEAL